MSNLTPQDLGSSLSVLNNLLDFANENNNIEMREKVEELIAQYNEVISTPDPSDMTILPYNRRDAYSILEYLKLQAEQLSDGKWTDFSDGDIGTIFLKLMSYLADMNNFQVDKVVSELYLNTVTERASAISLCSLIGYEPRHYESAYSTLTLTNKSSRNLIPDGTIIPAYSIFSDDKDTIHFSNLNDAVFYNNLCSLEVYQGNYVNKQLTLDNISNLGRIYLDEYNIGTNTLKMSINGTEWKLVDDVRYETGSLSFSIHITVDKGLYIQLPSYWQDYITRGTNIQLRYLLTDGEDGRIGKNILTKINSINSEFLPYIMPLSNTSTQGGYNPETVDELKISVPKHARTMNTIVTINDFEEVGSFVSGISDIAALDYNDPSSGLVQPDDYYKVYMYVLPDAETYDATDIKALKYRNTIMKDEDDWEFSDMDAVAEDVEIYSQNSVSTNSIYLENIGKIYSIENVIPAIYTGAEETSYIIDKVNRFSENPTKVECMISKSGDNYTITFNNNWKSLLGAKDVIHIYYKQEQILTKEGQRLRDYIDERRLASLNVTYHELEIIQPFINIDIYMDRSNVNFDTIDSQALTYLLEIYSREYIKIGDPIFSSVIAHDLLEHFDSIRYCTVQLSEDGTEWTDKIEVTPKGFIDIIPDYLSDDGETILKRININVKDYQNREI